MERRYTAIQRMQHAVTLINIDKREGARSYRRAVFEHWTDSQWPQVRLGSRLFELLATRRAHLTGRTAWQ